MPHPEKYVIHVARTGDAVYATEAVLAGRVGSTVPAIALTA
jgi:hypothetical protein